MILSKRRTELSTILSLVNVTGNDFQCTCCELCVVECWKLRAGESCKQYLPVWMLGHDRNGVHMVPMSMGTTVSYQREEQSQGAILNSPACIQDGAISVVCLVLDVMISVGSEHGQRNHKSGKIKRERLYKHTLITYSYWRQKRYLRTSLICKKNVLDKLLLIKEGAGFYSGFLQPIPCLMSQVFMIRTLHWQIPSNKYQNFQIFISRWKFLFHFIISEFSGMQKGLLKLLSAVGNKFFCFAVVPQWWSLCKMTTWEIESSDSVLAQKVVKYSEKYWNLSSALQE